MNETTTPYIKLLHTADWQLGKRFGGAGGDAVRERLHAMRFQALERLVEVARRQRVAAMVVAGDVFDEMHPSLRVVQRAADALSGLPCPLLLLPGNHDPASTADDGGPLHRLAELRARGRATSPTVVLDAPRRYEDVVPGIVFWAAPVAPMQQGDPTDWIAESGPPEDDGRLHVLVAHGGERSMLTSIEGGEGDPQSPAIDIRRFFEPPFAGRFVYAALGDWHSPLSVEGTAGRARYSGTPERCSWKERDPGHAMLVTLPEGAVEVVNVGRGRWARVPTEGCFRLQDGHDLGLLRANVEELGALSETWLRLSLRGAPPFEVYDALRTWLDELAERCLQLEVDEEALRPMPSEEAAATLRTDPVIGPLHEALTHALQHAEQRRGERRELPGPDEVDAFAGWVEGGGLQASTDPSQEEVLREALRELIALWQQARSAS